MRLAPILPLLLMLVRSAYSQEPIPGLTASISQPVFPVLIGNELNPLLRLEIDAGKIKAEDIFLRNDVTLTSITFDLTGTEALRDIASLTLYCTNLDDDLVPVPWPNGVRVHQPERIVVGGPARPRTTVTFYPNRPILGGKNVFWLSCKVAGWAAPWHRIAVACTAVETTAGRLAAPDQTAGTVHHVGLALRKHGDDGVDSYGIPVLCTTAKGTLLGAYDMRWRYPGHDLQGEITTGLSRSVDGGLTWEPVRIIMDMGEYGGLPREENGCSDPGIIVDRQTGEIFCFSTWMNGMPGHHQWKTNGAAPGFEIGKTPQFIMVRSKDDGKTWSQPENLTRQIKNPAWWLIAPSPESGIQLADGTLVMPVEGRKEEGVPFSTLMISHDHGEHWKVGTPGFNGGGECQAAQLGDGSIMLNMRTVNALPHKPYRGVYVTTDLGQTWKEHPTHQNTLIEPACNGSLLRVDYDEGGAKKHVLLFTNPHSKLRRINQTIQVSFDDGMTWPEDHHLLIDQGFAWAYPSLTRVDAQHIGILYSSSQADLAFQIIPLDELLRGTVGHSGKSP